MLAVPIPQHAADHDVRRDFNDRVARRRCDLERATVL
jgi:hypothetical protein